MKALERRLRALEGQQPPEGGDSLPDEIWLTAPGEDGGVLLWQRGKPEPDKT